MKAKELAAILLQNPDRDVIFWDGTDNWEIDAASPDDCNDIDMVLCNQHQSSNPVNEATISSIFLDDLLEQEDYSELELEAQELQDLQTLANQWEDRASIEIELNQFLDRNGYCFDDEICRWYEPFKQ
jgi:hypothetical protein